MTRTEEVENPELVMRRDPGYREVQGGLQFMWPEQFIIRIGMKGLNWIIKQVLDHHYPVDAFPADIVMPSWLDDHGGESFDPGVKWVALLRAALKEIDEPGS